MEDSFFFLLLTAYVCILIIGYHLGNKQGRPYAGLAYTFLLGPVGLIILLTSTEQLMLNHKRRLAKTPTENIKIWTAAPSARPRKSLIVAGVVLMLIADGIVTFLFRHRQAATDDRVAQIERRQYLSSLSPMLRFCEEQPEPVRSEYIAYYFELNKKVSREDITANYFLQCRFPEIYPLVHRYMQDQVPFSEQESGKYHAQFVIRALETITNLCVERKCAPKDLPRSLAAQRVSEVLHINQ